MDILVNEFGEMSLNINLLVVQEIGSEKKEDLNLYFLFSFLD